MEKLLILARQLSQPPIPPTALQFQERCQTQLSQLTQEQKPMLNRNTASAAEINATSTRFPVVTDDAIRGRLTL